MPILKLQLILELLKYHEPSLRAQDIGIHEISNTVEYLSHNLNSFLALANINPIVTTEFVFIGFQSLQIPISQQCWKVS